MLVYDVESEIGTFDCSHNGFYRLNEFLAPALVEFVLLESAVFSAP